MSNIRFALEKRKDSCGQEIDTLVKYDGEQVEEWGTVQDFDRLFSACVARWGQNWDLEKVMMAIRESEID